MARRGGPQGDTGKAAPGGDRDAAGAPRPVVIQSFCEFIKARKPVQWAVQNIVQRGYIYSLTALWGHGKTAAALPLAMHVAAGVDFAGHRVAPMPVLYMAGENPDDVRLRALKAADVFGLDHEALDANLLFTTRSFNLTAEAQAAAMVKAIGEVVRRPARDVLRRCLGFAPIANTYDSRVGRELWPELLDAPAQA